MRQLTTTYIPPAERHLRADARRNVDRIIAEATTLIAEQGANASLEEIARNAGVGIGTLYRHFPSREELLVALMDNAFRDLHQRADELKQEPDAFAALQAYLAEWMRTTSVYKDVAAELMHQALTTEQPWATSCYVCQADSQALLQRAQEAGQVHPDVTYMDVWRLLGGVAMSLKKAGLSHEEGRTLFAIIMRGLHA